MSEDRSIHDDDMRSASNTVRRALVLGKDLSRNQGLDDKTENAVKIAELILRVEGEI